MFAAAISLVGLAATVYLVLREAKAIRAQSGTVTKGAAGCCPVSTRLSRIIMKVKIVFECRSLSSIQNQWLR